MRSLTHYGLAAMFRDEDAARRYLEQRLWKGKCRCPQCESTDRITPRKGGYYRCNACKLDFTVRTGTVLQRSHIPLHKWVHAMHRLATARESIPGVQLSRELGITQKSAWLMLRRLRSACGDDFTIPTVISEADDCLAKIVKKRRSMLKKPRVDALSDNHVNTNHNETGTAQRPLTVQCS